MAKQCKLTPFNNNKVMRVCPIDEENPEPFESRLGRADTHQKDTCKKKITAEVNDSDSLRASDNNKIYNLVFQEPNDQQETTHMMGTANKKDNV